MKNPVIPALVIALLGTAAYAWHLQQTLDALRSEKAQLAATRAEEQKRSANAEAKLAQLDREVAQLREKAATAATGPTSAVQAKGRTSTEKQVRPGREGFAALMENPEFQKLWMTQQKSALDYRYAALFKNLKLSPAELDRFKQLLVEKQSAAMDVMAAARAEGLAPGQNRDEVRALVQSTQQEIDASIRAALGEQGFNQYKQFEQTAAQRTVVDQLSRRLSYSDTPLNEQQTEQLVRILTETSPRSNPGATNAFAPVEMIPGSAGPVTVRVPGQGNSITPEAIARAQTVLSPAQVQALTELQQQQEVQAAMTEMLRAQRRPGGTGTPTTANPAPKSGG